jgi:hypothetical protein
MRNNRSKLELLTKFRDIHRANPAGVIFQITTQGHSAVPNRINRYVRDAGSVSMNSKGIRLGSAGNNPGFETINYAETMGISYTLPNNTHHRLY